MNIEISFANIGTHLQYATIIDKNNKEAVEYGVLHEGDSGAPEDLDVDASANTEVTKHQVSEASAHHEVPEDLEADTSFLTEVPKDHEFPVAR